MARQPSNLDAQGHILNDPTLGPSPVVDPSAEDPQELSPTTMVLNYLKARGFQPTTENVRRALESNAWNPGAISGLRSDVAAIDPTDTGGGGRRLPVPPIPPNNVDAGRVNVEGAGGSPGTSAGPASQAPRIMDWLREVGPTMDGPTLPPPTVGDRVPVGGPPRISPPPQAMRLPNPLEEAMTKAMQLGGPPGQLALPAPEGMNTPRIAGPKPQLALPAPSGAPALPAPTPGLGNFGTPETQGVGVPQAPQAAAPQPQGNPGARVIARPVAPPDAAPQVPFNSPGPRVAPTEPAPSGLSSRVLEGFKAGGGVRGAIRGTGGKIGGLGSLLMLGVGAKDIYDEWQRQHGAKPGS